MSRSLYKSAGKLLFLKVRNSKTLILIDVLSSPVFVVNSQNCLRRGPQNTCLLNHGKDVCAIGKKNKKMFIKSCSSFVCSCLDVLSVNVLKWFYFKLLLFQLLTNFLFSYIYIILLWPQDTLLSIREDQKEMCLPMGQAFQ